MKKLCLLTSLLALTACGGGSGGGAGDPFNPTFGAVSEEVRLSNAEILSMDSTVSDETKRTQYLKDVFGDEYDALMASMRGQDASSAAFNLGRGSSTKAGNVCKSEKDCNQLVFDKMIETLRNLDNIETLDQKGVRYALIAAGFKDDLPGNWDDIKNYIKENVTEIQNKAEEVYKTPGQGMPEQIRLDDAMFSALITTGASDIMTLNIDSEGKVIGVKFEDVGSGSSKESPANLYSGLNRIGDTNQFDFNSDKTTGKLIMESYAKELGLKYSDFGVLVADNGTTVSGNDISGFSIPFMGGYLSKHISTQDLQEDVTFRGIAKGTVNPANSSGADNLMIEDTNATLAFNKATGKETFSASFNNWYDIEIVNQGDGVKSFTAQDNGKTIEEPYQLKNKPLQAGPNEQLSFENGYFGDEGVPEEAVLLLQYQQRVIDNPSINEDDSNLNLFLGFGGKAE